MVSSVPLNECVQMNYSKQIKRVIKENTVMIIIKYLQINQILALNNL